MASDAAFPEQPIYGTVVTGRVQQTSIIEDEAETDDHRNSQV